MLLCVLALSGAIVFAGSTQPDQANKEVGPVKVDEFGLWNALGDLAQQKHFVIGLVGDGKQMEYRIKLDLGSASVGGVLDELVKQAPAFSWHGEPSGTFCMASKSPVLDLANLRVFYPGATNVTREQFWNGLAEYQPVNAWLKAHSCRRFDIFNGYEFRERNEPMDIRPAMVRFADLLDEVASQSGANFWAIIRRSDGDGKCSVQIILW